ncbi:MAG: hypothetical protein WCA82_06575, partial [Jiangellales bacterium]
MADHVVDPRPFMTSDETAPTSTESVLDMATSGAGSSPDVLRLVQAFNERFAPHLDSAAAAVREAEQSLATAQDDLTRARHAAENRPYVSDPLVFMRASLDDEVDGLRRKTTPKKVQAAYRYMLARAVELAVGEVQGYRDDQAALDHQREHGVDACQQAERAAAERLDA